VMWRNVGIERTGARLAETDEIIGFWGRYVLDKLFDDRIGWETQNMLTIARLITALAMAREESRGVHFRTDYPDSLPDEQAEHLVVRREPTGLAIDRER